jgi:hypothetical protein
MSQRRLDVRSISRKVLTQDAVSIVSPCSRCYKVSYRKTKQRSLRWFMDADDRPLHMLAAEHGTQSITIYKLSRHLSTTSICLR